MHTQRFNYHHNALAALRAASDALFSGGVVAFPTETVYGLGANALDGMAVSRIFEAKGRPATDPLIVHIGQLEDLSHVVNRVPDMALQLAELFWPGPLTLILPRNPAISQRVSAGLDTVGVRVPAHPIAQELLKMCRLPIAAPSANRFTAPSPTTAEHVLHDLDGRIDVVIDGGPTPIGLESTVLDLSSERPRILRPGALSIEQLQIILPELEFAPRTFAEHDPSPGPGMMLKHYAPQTPLTLIEGHERPALISRIKQILKEGKEKGRKIGLIAADDIAHALDHSGVLILALGEDIETIGRNLFASIRDMDGSGLDQIYAVLHLQAGLGIAVRDRLFRAAQGHVETV